MPTYQYRCHECGQDLEVVQKFTDAALTECPNCHGALRKVYNAVGVVFKGSGFYSTDNRTSGSKASTTSESSSAKADSSKSTTGTKTESSTKSESSASSSASKAPAKAAAN